MIFEKDRMVYWICLMIFYLAGISSQTSDTVDYGYDYLDEEYMAYEEVEFDEEITPEFNTTPTDVKVSLGGIARLLCEVKDLGPNTISWRKVEENETSETTYLAVGPTLLINDPRYQVTLSSHGSTLQIILVKEEDQGNFQCQVFSHPPIYLTHSLSVQKSPNVTVVGKPDDGVILLKEGDELALVCQGDGNPAPRISWRRQNKRLVDGSREIVGDQLIYKSVNRRHSGIYVCHGNNGFGAPAQDSVEVVVQYATEVSLDINYIHQKNTTQVEIICYTQGQPHPKVDWTGVQDLQDHVQIFIRKGKEILIFSDIKLLSNRTILCQGTNPLGESSQSFHFPETVSEDGPLASTNKTESEFRDDSLIRRSTFSKPAEYQESMAKVLHGIQTGDSVLTILHGTKLRLEGIEASLAQTSEKVIKSEMIGMDVLKKVKSLEKNMAKLLNHQESILNRLAKIRENQSDTNRVV